MCSLQRNTASGLSRLVSTCLSSSIYVIVNGVQAASGCYACACNFKLHILRHSQVLKSSACKPYQLYCISSFQLRNPWCCVHVKSPCCNALTATLTHSHTSCVRRATLPSGFMGRHFAFTITLPCGLAAAAATSHPFDNAAGAVWLIGRSFSSRVRVRLRVTGWDRDGWG